jgi:ADP-ribose pyrophosphatase
MTPDAVPSPEPIRRRAEVAVFRSSHGTLYDDEVASPTGADGRYLRWAWARDGVLVVPRHGERVCLVPMYRYPVGAVSLEFPRGGRDTGEDPREAARRELREETGYVAARVDVLGLLHADTGLVETPVTVVAADVTDTDSPPARAEPMESVGVPRWYDGPGFLDLVARGDVSCALTIAAFTMATVRRSGVPGGERLG